MVPSFLLTGLGSDLPLPLLPELCLAMFYAANGCAGRGVLDECGCTGADEREREISE